MASRRGQDEATRRTHVEDGLEIPDHLEGVTFDQKKRLARLAKMGLGPVAKPGSAPEKTRRAVTQNASAVPNEDGTANQQQQLERRAALLERERRLRLESQRQEEAEQFRQREEERKRQEREKAARARAGLTSLGPVQPREEAPMPKPTVGYPVPAPLPFTEPQKIVVPAKMEVKLYASTVERVASSTNEVPEQVEEESEEDEDAFGEASSSTATAQPKLAGSLKADKRLLDDRRRRKAKKKRKRKDSSDTDEDKPTPASPPVSNDEEASEEEARQKGLQDVAKKQARDGGISWNVMHVESVKGKVSTANKGFTDADLERRFGPREQVAVGGLMTEEEVLAIMRKDKKGKSDSDWAMRRAQKELAEWTSIKAQRMARTGEEKERLVVSGRGSKLG